MGGKASRTKGARGELEVGKLIAAAGFHGARMGRNGYSAEDVDHSVPNVHFEVKRTEKIHLPAWLRQAEDCAEEGETPIVAFRQSHQPWRAVVPLEWLLELLADKHGVR